MKLAYLNLIVAACAVVLMGLTHNPFLMVALFAIFIANLVMIAVNVSRVRK